MEFQDKTVIVTGSGEVSARTPQWCFLVRGAHVVMYGNLQDAQSVAQRIVSAGGMAVTFETGVTQKTTLQGLVAETVKPYGTLAFW